MLDIKRIRENLEDIKKAMDRRGEKEFNLDEVVELDDKRKELLKEVEVLKNKMNVESKKIPQLIKEGKDITEDKANLKKLSDEIKSLDEKIKIVNDELEYKLLRIPNVPNKEVPQGETDEDNVEVSITYGANGQGADGYATLTDEQKEIASYVYKDVIKESGE